MTTMPVQLRDKIGVVMQKAVLLGTIITCAGANDATENQ